jgi:predicted DNA-binding antitoxin AbrB/MazE fold protein
MSERITAVVEDGLLRPTEPLALPNGTRLDLTITGSSGAVASVSPMPPIETVKKIVAAIAAIPIEPGPQFSGRDHDRILYGANGAR